MANWTHRYRNEQIPPAGAIGGVITAHRPGRQIADAITELQDRVITDIDVQGDGIEDTGSSIVDNTLRLRLRVDLPDVPEPYEPSGESGPCVNLSASFNSTSRVLTISGTTLVADNGLVVSSQPFSAQVTIPGGETSGLTTSVPVVTSVIYDSASRSFRRESRTLTFTNGRLTAASTPTTTTFLTLQEFACS
jgi:hypothetical protein